MEAKIVFSAIAIYIVFIAILWISEVIEFNKGKCRHCGGWFEYFDTDSQGGRGYVCEKCGNVIWIGFPVDKRYPE